MKEETKERVAARLRKVAGIQRMIDSERYWVDVMLQVSAARAALAKGNKMVLESHIQTCVSDAVRSDECDARDEKLKELVRIFDNNCSC